MDRWQQAAAQIAEINARMFVSPVDAQLPPEGWHPDRSSINPMPPARSKTLAGDPHPPLQTLDGGIHEDLIRTRYIEPMIAHEKRRLDANKQKLDADRRAWWSDNG